MRIFRISAVLIFIGSILWSCDSFNDSVGIEQPNLIPWPNDVYVNNQFSDLGGLQFDLNNIKLSSYGDQLISEINHEMSSLKNIDGTNSSIDMDADLAIEEYRLIIDQAQLNLKGGGPAAIQYGLETIRQLAIQYKGKLPIISISDKPRFQYRGMHLDVSRHFFNVGEIKKYIDFLAEYKYNSFHWHLTDDQGWRIEIKKYPKLQEVAAYRAETLIGHYNDNPQKYDGTPHGGYYTQEQAREIVQYAKERNITVIPEIELPGHSRAALAAYPELGCYSGPYETATKWGVFEEVYCPKENTFRFLEDVLSEVIDIFPSNYIHIGGDECPKTAWKTCAHCQNLIRTHNLKDEAGLQSYFIKRIEKFVNKKERRIIGWDEILDGGLAPDATVMSWRGEDGAVAAAKMNHDVIMTPMAYCYFDSYQSTHPAEPVAIGGFIPIPKVYDWEPIPADLPADKHKYVLGGQGNVWSEYISSFEHVEYMAYARAMALSEVLWSMPINKNYENFLNRLNSQLVLKKADSVNVANHLADLNLHYLNKEDSKVHLYFDPLPSHTVIKYGLAGESKKILQGSDTLSFYKSGKYSLHTLNGELAGRESILDLQINKATAKKISTTIPPHPKYSGDNIGSLNNGILGPNDKYSGNEWLGWDGDDFECVIDLEKETEATELSMRFFKGEGQWIYLPKSVELLTSKDNITFSRLNYTDKIHTDDKVARVTLTLNAAVKRYIKIKVANYGLIPEGNQGAGHRAWLFIDEISLD